MANQVKAIDTVLMANIKNFLGLTDANIKNINGLEFTQFIGSTRGLFGGGTTGSASNVIDYVTIASTGNATDFGDLTVARYRLSACSNAHGGL